MFTAQDFKKLPQEQVKEILSSLTPLQLEELKYDWRFWGRPEQQEPEGNWKIWMPLAGRGWGKDIVKTEDILTANKGWIKLSEIEIGDTVFAWDGSYTKVTDFYDPEPRQLVKFTFSDGVGVVSSVEHDWMTQTKQERKKGLGIGSKRTTQSIIDTFTVGKRKDRNHSVILAKPLKGEGKFEDPYYLGYWIGDGISSSFNSVAVGEEDREWVKLNWPDLDYIGNCIMRSPTGSRNFMRGYNLSNNKHVPRFVFSLTCEQRLEVLRGLMDSDGYCGKSHVEFCTTSKTIADGFIELVRGLGQKPRLLTSKATLNGVVVSDKYRIKWKPSQGINPFKMPRKAKKVSFDCNQDIRNQHRMIVSYEYVDYEPTRCIEVDHPDHVFLIGKGLVPTHNTRCGSEWVRRRIKSGDGRVACVAPTKGDVRRVMVEGESGLLNICWKGDKTYKGKSLGFPVWSPTNNTLTWENGAKAEFFSAEDPERLRGPQFHSAWCFIEGTQVVTDAGEKDVKTLQVGQMVLTSKGFKRILATSQRPSIVGTVKFSNGKELTGTYEHPIWTNRGWVKLGELKEKDIVCAINVLNGTVSGGVTTMTDTTNTGEQDQKVAKIGKDCTGQFTKITMEKFQKVSTYITKMVTKLTTGFQTLNSYLGRNTCATTGKSPPSQWQITSQCDTKQTVKTVVRWLKEKLLLKQSFVNSVSSKRQTTSVKLLGSAGIAEKPLSLFEETSVVNVVSTWEEETEQVVYNIQVEDCPEYFANGILTHNCDEICAWSRMEETWDMLQFTLRLGKNPRVLVTTTPKPVKLLRNIIKPENIASGRVYKTSGSSYENSDNINLEALQQYEGTRLGRQELYAEILDEAAGALWNRQMIDDAQFDLPEETIVMDENKVVDYRESVKEFSKTLSRIVVSIDPAITANEESDLTGIMVVGIDINGTAYILEDATGQYMPEQWAQKAVSLYEEYEADLIVAERNQGGDMVKSTLRTVNEVVPVKLVHASRGKYARAEPVSALYERGKIKHVKYLESLEEQMVTWEPLGSIGSPDRLDAMVWAITNLLLKGRIQNDVKIGYKTINF